MLLKSLIIVTMTAYASAITYDQRQTGDVNVEISLKDVQVVALVDGELLEDYTDYNYNYDYSDFTIKPPSKPSTSPGSYGSTTDSAWYTWPTNPPKSTEKPTVTDKVDSSNATTPSVSSSSSPDVESTESPTTGSSKIPDDVTVLPQDTIENLKNSNKCQPGFSRDRKGNCKKGLRRRLSFFPRLALRMRPRRPATTPAS